GNNCRCMSFILVLFILIQARHDTIRHVHAIDLALPGSWIAARLQSAIMAAQPLLKPFGSDVKCKLGLLSLTGGLKFSAAVEANHAIGTEAAGSLDHVNMTIIAAIEILGYCVANLALDARAEGIADIHVLTRNAESHSYGPFGRLAI